MRKPRRYLQSTRVAKMNYYAYTQRRLAELSQLRFKLHRLLMFMQRSDFERIQTLLNETEQILKGYER